MRKIVVAWILLFSTVANGSPLSRLPLGDQEAQNPYKAMDYLMNFGYMKRPTKDDPPSQLNMDQALKQFQKMANIPETGQLDVATLKMMKSPRCGVSDVHPTANNDDPGGSPAKYALQGNKWDHTDLTYRINSYTPDLSRRQVDDTIAEAFTFWSDITPLTFTKKIYGKVDIDIRFVYGDHGDGYPFDAQWGTLAHAFFPLSMSSPISGDTHFDESEVWTLNSPDGANLLQVAVHEFGHALGILHSNVQNSIMWPFAKQYDPRIKLAYDDIIAIQTLYGAAPRPTPSTTTTRATTPSTPRATTPSTPTQSPPTKPTTTSSSGGRIDHCSTSFDAVTVAVDDQTYFFKDDKVFRVGRFGLDRGFPILITDVFPGAPTPIDAALTYKGQFSEAKTYLFKGDSYWRYSVTDGPQAAAMMKLDFGYPKKIKDGWKVDVKDLDAVFTFGEGNNKLPYFVKGNQYWRHTGTGRGAFTGYPRRLSTNAVFSQIPESAFDTVFQWTNDKTYFFKGDIYHRAAYQKSSGQYHMTHNRDIGKYWFGCRA